jgi:hypothetical protein
MSAPSRPNHPSARPRRSAEGRALPPARGGTNGRSRRANPAFRIGATNCGSGCLALFTIARLGHPTTAWSGGRRLEDHRNAVHTIAQACRLRAIIEDMTEMAAASAALNRRPYHAEGCTPGLANGPFERRPETRPAGVAIELRGRGEQVSGAAGASEGAGAMLLEQRTRKGGFRPALPQHRVLLGSQQRAPLGVAVGDLERSGRGKTRPPSRCDGSK